MNGPTSGIELRGLWKSYGAVTAVAGVDLAAPAGIRIAIVGPSGSGKTTLLRLIAGFELPDAGSIRLEDRLMASDSDSVPAHKRQIGYLPQDGALFPHLSVADNIGFGLTGDRAARLRRIDELMAMVALDRAMAKRSPHELSGGQQQRVALARALAQRPRLMLLDEPFSALDTGLRAATRKAVAELLEAAGITTVLVTHDQAEALSFADQIAVMRQGRLIQTGKPRDLYLRPRDETTALFLGEAVILPARLRQGWADCRLGRLAVDDAARDGAARIMLRPEQLQLTLLERLGGAADGGAGGCIGTVAEVDFTGHACMLSVLPLDEEETGDCEPLLVRCPITQAPPVGSAVRITVLGPAHVLAAPPID